MKKTALILFTVFLNICLFSCTPQSLTEDVAPQACCGDDGDIPPGPPPVGGGGGG